MPVFKVKPFEGEGGGSGTEVIANPTLEGNEDELTGLEVGGTKYKVPSGGSNIYVCNYLEESDSATLTPEQVEEFVANLTNPNVQVRFTKVQSDYNVNVVSYNVTIDEESGDIYQYNCNINISSSDLCIIILTPSTGSIEYSAS